MLTTSAFSLLFFLFSFRYLVLYCEAFFADWFVVMLALLTNGVVVISNLSELFGSQSCYGVNDKVNALVNFGIDFGVSSDFSG